MNIKDEARKAANGSQFKSNHIYDWKSYADGFEEGAGVLQTKIKSLEVAIKKVEFERDKLRNYVKSVADDLFTEKTAKQLAQELLAKHIQPKEVEISEGKAN